MQSKCLWAIIKVVLPSFLFLCFLNTNGNSEDMELLGDWINITLHGGEAKIFKTEKGYLVEADNTKYDAIYGKGKLMIDVNGTTAIAYYDNTDSLMHLIIDENHYLFKRISSANKASAVEDTLTQRKGLTIPYRSGVEIEEELPEPDEFIPVEQQARPIYKATPVYPRLAREGGIEANVIIQACLDRNGIVRKAKALKCSHPNIGFEEAAVAAALKSKYEPAIHNGKPVAVWISYRVDFKISD